MTELILAIDLGTSGPKVALVAPDGEVLGCEFEETPVILLPEGGAEQDPEAWWRAIGIASRRLIGNLGVPKESVVAVACTGQWVGTVALDSDGSHLMNAMTWMDSRGASYCREITDGFPSVDGYGLGKAFAWIRKTGGIPSRGGKEPVAHILFIKNQFPEVYEKTYKFLEPKDYLNLRFTGRFVSTYDTIAMHWVTDNRDIDNIRYDDRLIAMAGIDRDKLPDLIAATDWVGEVLPEAAEHLGIGPGARVVGSSPDILSAAIGSGATRDFETHLYVGTSSWMSCPVPFKKTDVFHQMASLPSPIPGRYLVINEQSSAGNCLTHLIEMLFPAHSKMGGDGLCPFQEFDELAAKSPPGSGKLIFTPWLYGERTPVGDSSLRGGYANLSLRSKREHMARAVYEGVAYNSRWLMGYLEKFTGRRVETIRMIGGGARSDMWCQIFADVLDRRILQVDNPVQANARGAAFLASVALGVRDFTDVGDWARKGRLYEPNPENRAVYDTLFEEFRGIYKNNRAMYSRLNPVKE